MNESFKIRHVHAIVGVFVVLAVVAALGGLAYAGKARRWFVPERRLTIILPEEGSMGLRAGAEVMILGVVVGSVVSVIPDKSGRMSALVSVRTDFLGFVRMDSVVKVTKSLGFAGDAFVEISGGKGAELPATEAVLTASTDTDYRLARELLTQIRTEIIPTISELRGAFTEARLAIAEIRRPDGDFHASLAALRQVMSEVSEGNGLIGQLVRDPTLPRDVRELLTNTRHAIDDIRLVVADLKRTSAVLPEVAESARQQLHQASELMTRFDATLNSLDAVLDDLRRVSAVLPGTARHLDDAAQIAPGLLLQAQDALRELQRAAESMQRSWLFGGNATDPAPRSRLIAPEEVGGGTKK